MPDNFDVFLSYAHADSEWVRRLAENLRQSGLTVFFDEWEVGPQDVLARRLDADMASSYSQIGSFLTEHGTPEEGLALNLKSLAMRLELRLPQVRIDLHWLTRQRELLGEERFLGILRDQLDEDEVKGVLDLLEKFAAEK